MATCAKGDLATSHLLRQARSHKLTFLGVLKRALTGTVAGTDGRTIVMVAADILMGIVAGRASVVDRLAERAEDHPILLLASVLSDGLTVLFATTSCTFPRELSLPYSLSQARLPDGKDSQRAM